MDKFIITSIPITDFLCHVNNESPIGINNNPIVENYIRSEIGNIITGST